MPIKIAAWNVEQRLSLLTSKKRGTPARILHMIEQLNADILVVPEAYRNSPGDGVDAALRKLGYEWYDCRYDDRDRREEFSGAMPYIRVLSRLPIVHTEQHRWGDLRNLPVVTVKTGTGQVLRIIATHLDDRAEVFRRQQIQDIIPFVTADSGPTVMLGDFNAMHGHGRARVLRHRTSRTLAAAVPHEEIRSAVTRLTDMASGDVLSRLENETNLRDIDPRRRPTTTPKMRAIEWMPSVRLAQIDHILVSPEIHASDFKIARDGGSDHRAISAIIDIR